MTYCYMQKSLKNTKILKTNKLLSIAGGYTINIQKKKKSVAFLFTNNK